MHEPAPANRRREAPRRFAGYHRGGAAEARSLCTIKENHMDTFEINVEEKLRPSVERALTGTTALDTEISSLPLPTRNGIKRWAIVFLRKYRKMAPTSLRTRCVFEPSCSHYSELAFRQHGVLRGLFSTIKRLNKCKSGNGGIDLSNINKEKY